MSVVFEAWRSLWQRRARAVLTVAGMSCGVLALVLMGALAEHFEQLSQHFASTFQGRVYVCEKLSFWAGGGIIDEDKIKTVSALPYVGEVVPALIGRLNPERMVVVGLPMVVVGVPPAQISHALRGVPLAAGRLLGVGDPDAAVLGSDVAYAYNAAVGQRLHVLDHDFEVVGILSHTGALEDRQMWVPLRTAQKVLSREGLITSMMVTPAGVNPEALAHTLATALPTLTVIAPDRMREEVDNSLRLWRALMVGCGWVACLTGALCIVITMSVAVSERTYEVGLKKAIGASNGQIVTDFLAEAFIIGVLGWMVGALGAYGFVAAWDVRYRSEGLFLFSMTARVLTWSAAVAVLISLLAGSLPALSAARLDVVTALRRRR